jgi:hypothetical protein
MPKRDDGVTHLWTPRRGWTLELRRRYDVGSYDILLFEEALGFAGDLLHLV